MVGSYTSRSPEARIVRSVQQSHPRLGRSVHCKKVPLDGKKGRCCGVPLTRVLVDRVLFAQPRQVALWQSGNHDRNNGASRLEPTNGLREAGGKTDARPGLKRPSP